MKKIITLLCIVFLLSACGMFAVDGYDSSERSTKKIISTLEVIGKSYDQIWDAALKVANDRLVITDVNRKEGFIEAKKYDEKHILSGVVRIYIGHIKKGIKESFKEFVDVYARSIKADPAIYMVEFVGLKEKRMKVDSQDLVASLALELRRELGI